MPGQLQTVLKQEFAANGVNLDVAVTRDCGAVEVRVLGPRAALTLFFDAEEAQAANVRLAVRRAIARYGSSLGAPRVSEKEASS